MWQAFQSQPLLDEVHRRIEAATSLSVTVTVTTEEFPKPQTTKWWWKRGGYYRYESAQGIFIGCPTTSWSVKPSEKGYKVLEGVQTNWSLSREVGLDFLSMGLPPIGEPTKVTWHGKQALRVELDGKRMTKETRMYVYFDPLTHDPLGVSANLGSITQVRIFSDLKINPQIPASMFQFVPPKGYKLVKDGS